MLPTGRKPLNVIVTMPGEKGRAGFVTIQHIRLFKGRSRVGRWYTTRRLADAHGRFT
jgi:hypothetical protein